MLNETRKASPPQVDYSLVWVDKLLGDVVQIVPPIISPQPKVEGCRNLGDIPLGPLKAGGNVLSLTLHDQLPGAHQYYDGDSRQLGGREEILRPRRQVHRVTVEIGDEHNGKDCDELHYDVSGGTVPGRQTTPKKGTDDVFRQGETNDRQHGGFEDEHTDPAEEECK